MTFFKLNAEDKLSSGELIDFIQLKKEFRSREVALMKLTVPFSNLAEKNNEKAISLFEWRQDIALIDPDIAVEKLLFFDTETSHLNGFISSIALILTDIDGNVLDKLYLEINPGVKQDKEAIEVHGLTDEYLSSKPSFSEVFEQIEKFINQTDAFVAHNAIYDIGVLVREYERLGKKFPEKLKCYIDTMIGLKNQFTFAGKIKNPSLEEAAKAFNINLDDTTLHNALDDTELMLNVFVKAINSESKVEVQNV